MDNEELLEQVVSLMNEQTNAISKILDNTKKELRLEIKESETRIAIKIENEVTGRIESLFDCYKLTHEKQWELERRIEKIEQKLGIAI